MVSKNDYNRNIFSLGCITKFEVIKALCTWLSKVVFKNAENETFDVSIRAFVHREQTPVQPDTLPQSSSQVAMTYDGLKEKFDGLSQQYSQNRKELQELRAAKK
ncbi:hypothetical protein BGZ51_008661, partial [Haplosporangium sp. Z 767]